MEMTHQIRLDRRRRSGLGLSVGATVLVVAAVVAGAWGLGARRGEGSPARVGDSLAVPGGFLRVDEVRNETMMNMAAMGMQMSSAPGTAIPDPPKGFRRVSIVVSLAARTPAGLTFRPEAFRLGSPGTLGAIPVAIDTGPTRIPPGMSAARSIDFNVPEDAQQLSLSVSGAARPVAITVAPSHHHGGQSAAASSHVDATVGPGAIAKTIEKDGYTLAVRAAPNRTDAPTSFSVRLSRAGAPVTGAAVKLRTTMLDMGMGSQSFVLRERGVGTYSSHVPPFVMPGSWSLAFEVTPRAKRPLQVAFTDRVR
jgi:YtkA-like